MNSFVSLNLIDNISKESLFDYPIVYYWNSEDELEKMFEDKYFVNKLLEKSDKNKFFNLKAYLVYIYTNEDDELEYIKKEFNLHEVIDVPEKYYYDFLFEILNYLYNCSFKKDSNTQDIKQIFQVIRAKYPSKVNEEVVIRYIESRLGELYPNIPNKVIDKVVNIFSEKIHE